MRDARKQYSRIDWLLVGAYLFLLLFGWLNVFSSSVGDGFVWSLSSKYVMHLIWIGTALILACIILFVIPPRTYFGIAWQLFVLTVLSLIAVAVIGVEVNGSKSWFAIGPVRLQPAEFSKIATALVLAQVMGKYDFSFAKRNNVLTVFTILVLPMLAILAEKETGSMLVYLGFLVMFFREGMTPWLLILGLLSILFFILTLILSPAITIFIIIGVVAVLTALYVRKPYIPVLIGAAVILLLAFLPKLLAMEALSFTAKFSFVQWIAILTVPTALVVSIIAAWRYKKVLRNAMLGYLLGIGLVFSVQFIFDNVLQDHQRARIEVLLGIKDDPKGVGYNVHQSLIAIGSGGFSGKGFMGGTQTRFDFVPEQSTDFIFCTIGEEWGFLGTLTVLALYLFVIIRVIKSADKQNDRSFRVYGFCVAMCLLMHVIINICMTIGLMPVIGIPLPFLSYGGSSLWAFTILLFIYIRLDLERKL